MNLQPVTMTTTEQSTTHSNQRLWRACTDFEALILNSVLSLEGGVKGLTGQESSSSQYAAMVMPRVVEKLAQQSPLGLAELLYRRFEEHEPSQKLLEEA
jgi:hypothetical protein